MCSNFFSPSIPLAHAYAAPFSAPCNWAPLFGRRRGPLPPESTPDGNAPWQRCKGWRALALLLTRLPQHPSSCTAAGKGCARRATCDHMDAVCVSMPGTPPSTAATCLSRLAGAPCLVIIDRSHYSRRDREAFARSGELKQQLQGWHGQLSDMAVCISINGHPDHESTASRLSIRAASSQPGCAHASTLCGSTLAWTLQGLLQSFHDPGCRLHILRLRTQVCDDACISSCDPVQVFTFPDGDTSASGRVQMSLHSVGITHGPRDSPRANQLLDNSAVVTFMVLPSQTKIDLRASPWLVGVLPTRRGSAQACRWICCWSMVRGVCCRCRCMYTLSRRLRALHAYPPGSADSS